EIRYEDNLNFSFGVEAKDGDNDTVTAKIDIVIDDDGPKANDDGLFTVASLNTAVTANVITDGFNNGTSGADQIGADTPASIVGIKLGGESGSYSDIGQPIYVKADGSQTANPAESVGYLTIGSNGQFSFTQTAGVGQDKTVTFSYKVADADGDADTASFQVKLLKQVVNKPNFEDENVTVDEDGLPGGANPNTAAAQGNGDDVGGHQEGGQPNPASEAISRDGLNINWGGEVGSIVFNVSNAQLAALLCHNGLIPTTANVSGNGTDNLIVWDGVPGNSNKIIEFKVIDAEDSTYDVILHNPVKHAAGNQENDVNFEVDVTAGNSGGSETNQVTVRIDDDMPTLAGGTGSFNLSVDETDLGTDAGILNVDLWFPAGTAGADGGTTTFALTKADGQPITDGTATGLVDTLTGQAVFLYKNGANVEGRTAGGVVVFVISLNGAELKFDQKRSIEHGNTASHDEPNVFVSGVHVTKTITDKDGDSASLTASSAITTAIYDDGPNANDDGNSVVTFGQPIWGNVVANDSSGADVDTGFPNGKVESFTIDGNTYAADGVTAHNIPGHGTMKMFSNGDFEFTQTGGSAGSLEIEYKLLDGDGDSDTAKLTITTKDQPIENYIVVGENVDDTSNQTTDHRVDNSPNAPDGSVDGASGKDVLIGDVGGKQTIIEPGKNYSLALVCDTSTSMDTGGRMNLLKSAVTNFVNQLLPHNGVLNITLISFGSDAATEITLTLNNGNLPLLLQQISDLQAGQNSGGGGTSFTNYEQALQLAKNYMDGQPGSYEKHVYFMTDGVPTTAGNDNNGDDDADTDLNEIQPALNVIDPWMVADAPVQLHGIGITSSANANLLRYFDNTSLQPGTVSTGVEGGTVTDNYGQPLIITSAEQLTAALVSGGSETTIFPVGDDLINGGAGNDAILGDSIYFGSKDAGWAAYIGDVAHAGWTPEQIRADIYANLTTGDKSYAQEGSVGGDDTINGGAGNDVIFGQGGNDTIHGDADDDRIDGGSGADTLFGDGGNDYLIGGAGIDTLNGGIGNDTLVYDGQDTFDGGDGFDVVKFESPVDINIDNDGGAGNNFIGRVTNVEAIDLRNGSTSDDFGNSGDDNALSASDVLDITGGGGVLYILGDGNGGASGADDQVDLTGFAFQQNVTVNDPSNTLIHGLTFAQYTSGGATVFVQNTIDVE
ncbi:DUF5801 repeats-in-toxin domain-containing protein, partial [Dongia sp.]|uniref:DUF5801 repeats-in-toxin domain-containing protein n=1 Tax=Dongia sp. TaxID=1977262 RepID=UPI0035B3A19A